MTIAAERYNQTGQVTISDASEQTVVLIDLDAYPEGTVASIEIEFAIKSVGSSDAMRAVRQAVAMRGSVFVSLIGPVVAGMYDIHNFGLFSPCVGIEVDGTKILGRATGLLGKTIECYAHMRGVIN